MNRFSLVSLLLLLASFLTFATDSVDMKVAGTLKLGTCNPTLDGGGVVDFGHIPLDNLSKTGTNQLGSKNITLTIECSSAMMMGWTTIDNRADSNSSAVVPDGVHSAGSYHFGLGKTSGNVLLGNYGIIVDTDSVTADGNPVSSIYNQSQTAKMASPDWADLAIGHNIAQPGIRTIAVAKTGSTVPIAAKVFVYPLKVSAAIQGTDTLAITDNTQLDGFATISLVYL